MFSTNMVFPTFFVETLHSTNVTKPLIMTHNFMFCARFFEVKTFPTQVTQYLLFTPVRVAPINMNSQGCPSFRFVLTMWTIVTLFSTCMFLKGQLISECLFDFFFKFSPKPIPECTKLSNNKIKAL